MRKIVILFILLFAITIAFAQIAFKDKKLKQTDENAGQEFDYDAINQDLAKKTRDARIRKEKEKILNQEIKVKINESYKSVINTK